MEGGVTVGHEIFYMYSENSRYKRLYIRTIPIFTK